MASALVAPRVARRLPAPIGEPLVEVLAAMDEAGAEVDERRPGATGMAWLGSSFWFGRRKGGGWGEEEARAAS